jgi:cytochrome c-type biogenesis protein CcmH/NrfF
MTISCARHALLPFVLGLSLVLAGDVTEGRAQEPTIGRATAPAADSVLEARTSEVASQLRCPVCQGESIQDSPSALAQEMRALVRDQLAAGRTPDEVKAYFVSKYGEWILLKPRLRGINLVVYVAPFVVILGGGAIIALAVRKWIRTSTCENPNSAGVG